MGLEAEDTSIRFFYAPELKTGSVTAPQLGWQPGRPGNLLVSASHGADVSGMHRFDVSEL